MNAERSTFPAGLLAVSLVLAGASAQDTITWIDGKVTDKARITSMTLREVKYTVRGASESKPGEALASVDSDDARDAYKRAYANLNAQDAHMIFVDEARKLLATKPIVAQIGYIEGARVAFRNAKDDDAVLICRELVEKIPDSVFVPESFRLRVEAYLSRGPAGAKDADAMAEQYAKAATTNGWPDSYVNEATFYKTMAGAAAGKFKPAQLQDELRGLLAKVDTPASVLANRVRVQLGHSQLAEKKADEARKTFEEVLAKDAVDVNSRASAQLGLGHTLLAKGSPADKEPYRQALLAYLRVYVESGKASDAIVSEALYHGAQAAELWGGKDAGFMRARLNGILKRDYGETEWAKR
ncbi:MAG: hypothetical protein IT458_14240 [Planctomycetes bacterium]|nr:hypothetical protein [Planctomycetota bacterium]